MAHEKRHNAHMQEIELKFQIPAERLASVRQAIESLAGQAGAQALPAAITMHAAYYDTADNALARQRMALRVRREGDDWVQTFKAAGTDAMTRVEENCPRVVPDHGMPAPDLALHGDAARSALQRALPWQPADDPHGHLLPLQALYETRFERHQGVINTPEGLVLACIDEGHVVSGTLIDPLAELELELLQGHPQAVLRVAHEWVAQYGVWLDVHSKAYRGTRLAQARLADQPPKARPLPAPPAKPADLNSIPAARHVLGEALDAAAGNWSEVAMGRPGWSAAMQAWRDTLASLLDQRGHPGHMGQLMPSPWWQTTLITLQELDVLLAKQSAQALLAQEQDLPWAAQAQALAQCALTTDWALAALAQLKAD
jgi:inorganic triphosphatase YgiF